MMVLAGNPSLRNTGALLHNGIAPMCGELNRGITPNGVNIGEISAETIRGVPRVMGYALGDDAVKPFDPTKFEQYLDFFHPLRSLNSSEWTQLVLSLMHWNRENPKACAEFLNLASPSGLSQKSLPLGPRESPGVEIPASGSYVSKYRTHLRELNRGSFDAVPVQRIFGKDH